jgi:hypothetical protein
VGGRALPLSQHMLNSSEGLHAWLHVGDAAGKVALRCAKCEGSLADKGALCSERIMDSGVSEDWTACCCRKPPSTPLSAGVEETEPSVETRRITSASIASGRI